MNQTYIHSMHVSVLVSVAMYTVHGFTIKLLANIILLEMLGAVIATNGS